MDYSDCNIYAYSKLSHKAFLEYVLEMLNGKIDMNTIMTSDYEVYVEENDFYDESKCRDLKKGFIHYPYILEMEIYVDEQNSVNSVNRFLKLLWDENIPAVPTCDFEEELLNYDGGMNRKGIPRVL